MKRETEKTRPITYAESSVDIDAADRAVELIKEKARTTYRSEVLASVGPFAGLFQLSGYKEPVLVTSVDGVGTKVKIAITLDQPDTIGIDLVNHCVNDILTCGAEPLFFLDYLAVGKLIPEQVARIASGLSRACRGVGCALIGGETAEMPGIYGAGDYDLAGFIIGVVEKEKLLDGTTIEVGDAVLGLPSSGLHTNGYSLVRKVFNLDCNDKATLNEIYDDLGRNLGEELLEPHRCYYSLIKSLMWKLKGIAHITGGGIQGNLSRILPKGLVAKIDGASWDIQPIFRLIQRYGNIDEWEMYRVFNMGIGMILICPKVHVDSIVASIPEIRIIGEIVESNHEEQVIIL